MKSKNKISNFNKSAIICLSNAKRLISNAELLKYDNDTIPTSYALALLAQEEIAKAFLLYLIYTDAIPWNKFVQRSLHDHTCKQLWFIVLEALNPNYDEFLERLNKPNGTSLDSFIALVGDMLNWYRYAKIQTWEQGYCDWDDKPEIGKVKQISNGKMDKKKQDALYVKIDKQGKVISTPNAIKSQDTEDAIETANRFYSFANNLMAENSILFEDHLKWLKQTLKYLFTPEKRTGRTASNIIPGVLFYEVSRPVVQIPPRK